MSDVPTLVGHPVTLENCWTFILNQPEVFEKFIYFFLKQLLQFYLEQSPSSEEVENYFDQFGEESKLFNAEQFEQWLMSNNDSYDSFRERVHVAIAVQKFCNQVYAYKDIASKFNAKKHLFDCFVLSQLTFLDESTAGMVCDRIKKYPELCQEFFQTYPTLDKSQLNASRKVLIRANLPDEIQTLLTGRTRIQGICHFNQLIDRPLKIGEEWRLIYIHQFIPI